MREVSRHLEDDDPVKSASDGKVLTAL